MENRSITPRENDCNKWGKEEAFETEVNRMDYEGGNQGKGCLGKDCPDEGKSVPQKSDNKGSIHPMREQSEDPNNTRP